MRNYFFDLYQFANKQRYLFTGITVALLAALVFFAFRISFQENINQLIPSNDHSGVTSKVLEQVNFADKITIVVSSEADGSPEDLTEFANQFLDSIQTNCKPFIGKIQGKLEDKNIQESFEFVYNNLPLFLDQTDYKAIENRLQNDSIAKVVEGDYKSLISPAGIVSKDFILKDPLGISFIALKKLRQLSVGDDFELQNGFVLTKDRKNLLLFISPKLATNETDRNTLFIEELEKIKSNLNRKFSHKVSMSYFGATPVAVANATQIKKDVKYTSIFAMVTLILILAFFYRSVLIPIIIFIPSLFGAVFALTVLYFSKGSISAISLGISSILLGETTDYSIYVLTHLRNNKNVKLLYKDITKPLILCGITTSITFLCLFFIKSEALQDLGIFASLSVIATTVFSLILIPLLYRIPKSSQVVIGQETILAPAAEGKTVGGSNLIDTLGSYSYHKNKFMVAAMFLILIVSLFTYSKVTFNNDLSQLNFMTPELKAAEKKLEKIANISSKSIYLATYGNSYEEVVANNNTLFNALDKEAKKSKILNFSSIGGIVFSETIQKQKIQQWNDFWDHGKKSGLQEKLIDNGNKFGFKADTFAPFYQTLDKPFNPISTEEYLRVKSFFLDEFVSQKNGFYTISTLVKVPNQNRDAFVENIKNQTNIVVIDRQQTNETFLGTLKTNFKDLVDYSFIAVFFILLIAFRKIELVVVSIIPIMISWIFTTGVMGIFDIQFNVVNIIVCTLVFGIGVDYSIFMTTALQKEHTFGKKELPTYRTSILLSVATTILGIGVLIFAKHPALKSISLIAIIGIFTTLMITFILQPLVFSFFVTDRVQKGKAPFEIRRLTHSVLSFTYFGLGGFLMSIVSVVLTKILPISKKLKLKAFHFAMSKFMHSVLITYPSTKRKIINSQNETFDTPSVIIANHASFLDILAVGMLSPKIIFLVSDWVYNSPVFGKGVRLAGFYPVSSGIDNGIEHLRTKVEQGYSLMVFPEGSRSEDNSIKRFHKGAFYLAEALQLDIVPILIHGYSEVLPKGEFCINGGSTTVEILNRIALDDSSFGKDYSERTKKMSIFFKEQYKRLRFESEGPDYFKKCIVNSFDYKETAVIRAVKKDLNGSLELYHKLNSHIHPKARILHFANDYGQLDILLALQEPQRKVCSVIQNEEKRLVAETNYILRKRKIEYVENFESNKYDVVLISDGDIGRHWEKICNLTPTVILVYASNLKDVILGSGYEVSVDIGDLIVLFKK